MNYSSMSASGGTRRQVCLDGPRQPDDRDVRGEHSGLQYRLNGIILPEGIRSSDNRWIRG